MPEAEQVRRMFARVARRYDRTNRVLSCGIDLRWRRAAVRFAAVEPHERALDVCAGTGDLALALASAGAEVVGSDFCPEMLAFAVAKSRRLPAPHRPTWLAGDALRLPFPDASFDLATVAFGIRNVADPVAALAEMARVVRPGGRVVVLEFTTPAPRGLGALYLFYFRRVLPRLGNLVAGDRGGAYDYLAESVLEFPQREAFLGLMRAAGLTAPQMRLLTGGIAALYRGDVPAC
jgi:demethylmenaquinone methyltransferase/2-methoxy-6-polyprenyl-1,4-benzoquinol methylase